jgi:GR25 family glycosyltransferase involved in LPS biosynthesis
MTIPILYINLDRSIIRNNKMIDKLSNLNVIYERISGVDAQNISKNALIEGEYDDMKYHIKKNIKLKPGAKEIAIILSHIKALNKIIEKDFDIAVIIEDDLSFQYINNWNFMINNIINNAPSDWKILKLHTSAQLELNKNINLFEKGTEYIPLEKSAIHSAGCYIIKKEAAKELINKYKINDTFIFPHNDEYVVCECVIFSINNIYMYTGPYICVDDSNVTCSGGKNVSDLQTNKIIHSYWKKKDAPICQEQNLSKLSKSCNIFKPEKNKIITMRQLLEKQKAENETKK